MTAIDKFIRLEAIGFWREHPDAELIEVVVSFGDSTLQLTGLQDTPITHWALRAVTPIGTKGNAVIYSTDNQNSETLSVDDKDMNRAIRAVTNNIIKPEQKKPWLGKYVWIAIALVFLALLTQTPPMIYKWAVTLTAPARMAAFVQTTQALMPQNNISTCADSRGQRALTGFAHAVLHPATPKIVLLKTSEYSLIGLSDSVLYLDQSSVATAQGTAELAAELVLNHVMSERRAFLKTTLQSAGPFRSIWHFLGNDIPADPKAMPMPVASDFVIARDRLQNLGLSAQPLQQWAAALGIGLPIDTTIDGQDFEVERFATLKEYCAG